MALLAFTVSKSGSPGPAPTKVTRPRYLLCIPITSLLDLIAITCYHDYQIFIRLCANSCKLEANKLIQDKQKGISNRYANKELGDI